MDRIQDRGKVLSTEVVGHGHEWPCPFVARSSGSGAQATHRELREEISVRASFVRMSGRLAPLITLTVSGCIGETQGLLYAKVQDSQLYIPEELLTEMAERRWTIEAVVQQLGEPNTVSEATHTIGYERCVESRSTSLLAIGVPLPVPSSRPEAVHCQLVKLWLDEDGRVTRWADRVGMRPDVQDIATTDYLPCWLDSWVRGGSCER